jgi:hypothetical protein
LAACLFVELSGGIICGACAQLDRQAFPVGISPAGFEAQTWRIGNAVSNLCDNMNLHPMIGEHSTLRTWGFLLVATAAFEAGIACSGSPRSTSSSTGQGTAADSAAGTVTVFGDEMSLNAYAIHAIDSHTAVDLKWSALRKPAADYAVFVHVLAPSGATAFQLDHPLKNGAGQMTSAWAASDSVNDQFVAAPPTGQNPGN